MEFGADIAWTYVMGGLARDYGASGGRAAGSPETPSDGAATPVRLVAEWLRAAEESRMPIDPRLWLEGPISSTYPACMAVKAAEEQGGDAAGAYLRALREGLLCFRRKLDTTEALVEEARRSRLDVERFRVDLSSHAIVEAFGNDLERSRMPPAELESADSERIPLPTISLEGEGGETRWLFGARPYEEYRAAAEEAGAAESGEPAPEPLQALRRFGRMATREVEEACRMPTTRAASELWRLAGEWSARPVRVLTGYLWEAA